jgi:hypothetical protein
MQMPKASKSPQELQVESQFCFTVLVATDKKGTPKRA